MKITNYLVPDYTYKEVSSNFVKEPKQVLKAGLLMNIPWISRKKRPCAVPCLEGTGLRRRGSQGVRSILRYIVRPLDKLGVTTSWGASAINLGMAIRGFVLIFIFTLLSPPLPAQNQTKTLFTLLSPEKTNIHFENTLKDTKEANIFIYSNFYGGAGVGIIDINNDGLQDIFFAGNQVGDKLYLNKGNLKFEDITEQAGIVDGGEWSSGVAIGDVNQDGWQDIYVTRELYDDKPALRRNALYINQGNNTFQEQAEAFGVADTQRTRSAMFLDYDKDGDLDLFLCNQPPNPGDYSPYFNTELLQEQYSVRLMENVGNRFEDVTQAAGLLRTGFPNSATASDLNGDGWTDLYVANDFYVGDWMFLNNGDGTFTEVIHDRVKHISFSSMGVDAADLNNDKQLDLMVVDMAAEDNYRSKANMSGMNPKAFWKVVRDGGHYQYMFNTVQLNRGEGYFSEIGQLTGMSNTDWSWSNLIADFDNDGWKDVFVSNGLLRDIRNNDAAKTLKNHIESSLYKYVQKHANLDGKTVWDVVNLDETLNMVPSEKLSNYIYKNEGDLRFTKQMEAWGMDQKSFSSGAAYADLDNDGDLDVVVSNVNDKAFIFENHASNRENGNYLRVQLIIDANPVNIIGSKISITTKEGLNQFVELTSSRGMYSSSEMIVHFGLGEEEEVLNLSVEWPDNTSASFENIAANQTHKIFYKDRKPHASIGLDEKLLQTERDQLGIKHIHYENYFDDFKRQVLLPHKMSSLGPCMAGGDINGDGLEDVFVGGAAGFPAAMYIQQEDGQFRPWNQAFFQTDAIHEDVGAIFFDADKDGDLDLYVVSGGNEFLANSSKYLDRLYLNDGQGDFIRSQGVLPNTLVQSGSRVYACDYDRDGDEDLFVGGKHVPGAYPEPSSSFILRNDAGKFTDATRELAPDLINIGMVSDASWVDYDGDGWKDLIVVGEWMPITIFPNQKGLFGIPFTIPRSAGWWFSLETADMDGDGDMDLIAGNLGLNYKYKASEKEPFSVYYEDFDENGSKDIVLSYYNFGIEYPLRGRECSSEQVPGLKEKFANYDLFASADIFDVYGENNLTASLHYEANTFASVYLENVGDGQFEMHQLPLEAQFSSINDILIDDFNHDMHLDVLIAGNLFEAEVETPRNDASLGLLMLGDGNGNLKSIPYAESGVFLPYNVKSLIQLKTGTRQLILAGCNSEHLQVLSFPTKFPNNN